MSPLDSAIVDCLLTLEFRQHSGLAADADCEVSNSGLRLFVGAQDLALEDVGVIATPDQREASGFDRAALGGNVGELAARFVARALRRQLRIQQLEVFDRGCAASRRPVRNLRGSWKLHVWISHRVYLLGNRKARALNVTF